MAKVQTSVRGVRFLRGGRAVVLDNAGQIVTRFGGTHAETIALLAKEGIDWKKLPDKIGTPATGPAVKHHGGIGGVWDGKAPRDASGSFTVTPEAIAVRVPMLEIRGPAGQTPYRAFEISIKSTRFSSDPLAQEAIRFVQDAMSVTNAGVAGKSNPSAADAVLFVFHQLGLAWRAAKAPHEDAK